MRTRGPTSRPRVASWPHWYGPNPYLPLLYEALATHGIAHVPNAPLDVATFRGPARVADVAHLHWLYPLLREGRRAWLGQSGGVRSGLARLETLRELGVPIIWTVHNLAPHDGFRRGEREAYAAVHRMADLRVFHSASARAEARATFADADGDALIMYHGNFRGAFPPARPRSEVLARAGVPEDHRLLLCLGQIRRYKGFDLAVRMMRHAAGERWHLVVAGRAIDRSVRRLRRLAGRHANITLLTRELPSQDVADLLGAADVVLLPYRAVTGSGALMHALSAGRGVVASDLPYFREILGRAPSAGVLATPGDPQALAEAVHRFFSVSTALREEAAQSIAEAFAWSTVVAPLVRWIGDNLSRGRSAGS